VLVPALGGDGNELRERLQPLVREDIGAWPAPEPFCEPQPIAGLGQAPVKGFLVVLLVFAVLAGPVNFRLLRRWRRPLLVLVTVPALGLLTTLGMLGYGLLHDGFGVRGTQCTWSWLDQGRHEVASVANATLFTGLSPDRIVLPADVVALVAGAAVRHDRRSRQRLTYFADAGELDGALLPSRTVTPLVLGAQGPARQRLRLQRRADGDLDLLADAGLQPQGEVVVCDPDGRGFVGSDGRLRAVDDEALRLAVDRWRRAAGEFVVGRDGSGEQVVSTADLAARLAPAVPRRGGYWCRIASAPWLVLPELAGDVTATHFLCGQLATEDLLR
jgi:hypothetical protein